MKIYLHLFTTAGMRFAASLINFDPAELFCWSSIAGCAELELRKKHTHTKKNKHTGCLSLKQSAGEERRESCWEDGRNLLKILNGRQCWKKKKNQTGRERDRDGGGR